VNDLISLLGISDRADSLITLEKNPDSKSHITPNIPMPCTIRTALTYYLDINDYLKIRQFEVIKKFIVLYIKFQTKYILLIKNVIIRLFQITLRMIMKKNITIELLMISRIIAPI